MAIRRQQLRHRIAGVGGNQAAAAAGHDPGSLDGVPMTMPVAQVLVITPPGGQYSTITYQDMPPIFTADGAAVPASAPGRWAQLVAAGRP
jgi:hypothetical protein